MKKEPTVQPKCYKCGTMTDNPKPLLRAPLIASYEGYCSKCDAKLTWTYQWTDDEESWEYYWVRKRRNREEDK